MHNSPSYPAARAVLIPLLALVWVLFSATSAIAISAPIHIAGTGGEGVFIRPEPNTSRPATGWMPEGASPDYNCFVWGQNIGGVPIWFNVNYGGVTGYYASFYDDSSYHSNEELTAKYGVPLCGSAPPSSPPPPGAPSTPGTTQSAPAAVYFSPYNKGDSHGRFELGESATTALSVRDWETYCNKPKSQQQPGRPYSAALAAVGERPITTLAGWSNGRLGVTSFLAAAGKPALERIAYVLLIDPGVHAEMGCDRERNAGGALVRWLRANAGAHLVVISSSEVSQKESSRGIQETYFNAIRNAGGNLSSRVLTCNYTMEKDSNDSGHEKAFFASKYWIQHQIGSTRNACPWLSLRGTTYKPTAGWHPIN